MSTKVSRVLSALTLGDELTAKQISNLYKVSKPRDLILSLRKQGYPINLVSRGKLNKYTFSSEKSVSTYTIGH